MRIVFIEPKIEGPHYLSSTRMPRLGLPQLGAILEEKGHQIKIFTEEVAPIQWGEVEKADLVGISTITATAPRAYQIAQGIRTEFKIPVIMGGCHPTFVPNEALDFSDCVVRFEGEEIIEEVVRALYWQEGLGEIPNLSWKERDGTKIHNPLLPGTKNFDQVPLPNLELVAGWQKKVRITPIETSRGCPFSCDFCTVHQFFGQKVRYRNPEAIVEAIEQLQPRHIFFTDDNFAINPERTKKLLELIRRKCGIKRWSAQTSVKVARDPELLEMMKQSGCFRLFIGFESVNPLTLKRYRKPQIVEEIRECISLLHRFSLKIHGMFVLGEDSDDENTIWETLKFAIENKIDSIQLSFLTPLPGSALYQRLKKEGRILWEGLNQWRQYDCAHVVFSPLQITRERLQKLVLEATKRFYSWKQILRNLLRGDLINVGSTLYGKKLIQAAERQKACPFCSGH